MSRPQSPLFCRNGQISLSGDVFSGSSAPCTPVFFLWVWRSSDRSQTRFLSSGSWSFQALHSYVWDVSSAKAHPFNNSAAFAICLLDLPLKPPPKTRKAAVSIHESAAFPVFYQSFTIFGSCPIAGMIFSTRSFVRIFRLDVLIQGWHPKYSSFSTSSSIRS